MNTSQIDILWPQYADHSLKMIEARQVKNSTPERVWWKWEVGERKIYLEEPAQWSLGKDME